MNDLEPKNLVLAWSWLLESLLNKIESGRAYVVESKGLEMAELINEAAIKLYQADIILDKAKKL